MTENKKPLVTAQTTTAKAKNTIDKVAEKKADIKQETSKKNASQSQPKAQPQTLSKLAIFATILAIAVPTGHYFWQQQQSQLVTMQLTEKLSQESSANFSHFQSQIQQKLNTQQSDFAKKLQQVKEQTANASQEKIAKLNETVSQLEQRIKQRQPSDWLLHESEYLIRIAARTLWLEHDTTAAIGLLKDADARLTELNDPAFLPVRKLIHQDIKYLELMPTLQTDEVVLTLMALSKQVAQLPLAIEALGNEKDAESNLELSNDISDWQANLAKTWQKFFNNFIRIRPRTGSVEPLMSPQQQLHLKQNLSLKVQLTLWAASERKGDIYQKSLTDIEQWLNEFFDMGDNINQHFSKTLHDLKQKQVNYNYPSELAALAAIRTALRKQTVKLPTTPKKEVGVLENKNKIKTIAEETVATEKAEQQNNKPKNEGKL